MEDRSVYRFSFVGFFFSEIWKSSVQRMKHAGDFKEQLD